VVKPSAKGLDVERDKHQKEMAESMSGGLATQQKISKQFSKHLPPDNSCTQVRTTLLKLVQKPSTKVLM